jgi:hypothetical protein
MTLTTPPRQPIEWKLERLTVKDVIEIIHWYNSNDIAGSIAKLMIIARACTDEPLPLSNALTTVKEFVDAVYEYQFAIARADYERIKDKPP